MLYDQTDPVGSPRQAVVHVKKTLCQLQQATANFRQKTNALSFWPAGKLDIVVEFQNILYHPEMQTRQVASK